MALAVSAAAREDDKETFSPLLWGVPAVGLAGIITYLLDKKRRARR